MAVGFFCANESGANKLTAAFESFFSCQQVSSAAAVATGRSRIAPKRRAHPLLVFSEHHIEADADSLPVAAVRADRMRQARPGTGAACPPRPIPPLDRCCTQSTRRPAAE